MELSWLTAIWGWIKSNVLTIFTNIFRKGQSHNFSITTEENKYNAQSSEHGKNFCQGDNGVMTIHEGLSPEQTQSFLQTLVKSEVEKSVGLARIETEKRLSEFGTNLYKIVSPMPNFQQKFSLPEAQYSLYNATIQYVRTSDVEARKLLLNAVKMRLESNENSIITANIDNIVSNILLLTNTQMKIIFSLCALKYFPIVASNFKEFKNNIEEISSEILSCDNITTVALNGIVAHGFMVDDFLAMMVNSEIRVSYYMVQCNKRVFEENLFDISDHEKITEVVKTHFKKLSDANNILTSLNFKELSCTYAGIILTDLIFSAKFPHIRHASLEEVLDSLK